MANNSFVTETDPKYALLHYNKSLIIAFFILSFIACFGLIIGWQTFMFFEVIIFSGCFIVFKQNKQKGHFWKLNFEGHTLTITNKITYESFNVYDVSASDFIIKQSKREKQLNYCTLKIKRTVLELGGVKNCQQMKDYIQKNYK